MKCMCTHEITHSSTGQNVVGHVGLHSSSSSTAKYHTLVKESKTEPA